MDEIQKKVSELFVLITDLQITLLKNTDNPVKTATQILRLRDAKNEISVFESRIKSIISHVTVDDIIYDVNQSQRIK